MATEETGEPTASCYSGATVSVWYKIVGPASGNIDLSTDFMINAPSPNTDTEIAIYSLPGGDCTNFADLMELGCGQDISGTNFLSTINSVAVTPGDTFYVSVSGWNGAEGSFCLDAIALPPPMVADNDSVCNAALLTVTDLCANGSVANGSNVLATSEPGEPAGACFIGDTASVWFKFAAPASGVVEVSTDFMINDPSPNTDTEVALFAVPGGDCSVFTDFVELGCSQDFAGNLTYNSYIPPTAVTPGDTLYISVSGWNGTEGAFCLDVIARPVNDSAVNAIMLPVDGTVNVFNTVDATASAGEAALAPPAGNSGSGFSGWSEQTITNTVWFTFVAPASGAVSIDLCGGGMNGTNFDTQVAVYDVGNPSDFSTFSFLAANDDIIDCFPAGAGGPLPNTDPSIWASYVEVGCLTPGNTYYFLVDGFGDGAVGDAGIALSEIVTAPLALGTVGANPEACPTGGGGSLLVQVVGGGLPYDISWSNGATDTLELFGLDAGTYTLTLTDACDSVLTASVDVPAAMDEIPALMADAGGDAEGAAAICFGDSVTLGGMPAAMGGKPDLGSNVYVTSYDGAGDILWNGSIDDPGQYGSQGAYPTAVFDLVTLDFGENNLLMSINRTTNELVAINETQNPVTFFPLGVMTPVTPTHTFVNLMYDPSNEVMYAMSFDNGGPTDPQIYTVSLTGATTPVVTTPLGLPVAAAIDNNGTLYVYDASDGNLYTVDLTTGTPTLIGSLGILYQFFNVHDMDFDPTTNRLYLCTYNPSLGANEFREINVTNGVATPVGRMQSAGAGLLAAGMALAPVDVENQYDYAWTPPLALEPATGDVPNPVSVTPVSNTYTLTVTDACATAATDTIDVIVNDNPSVSVTSTPDNGTGNGTVSAMGMGGSGTYTYIWTNAAGDTVSMDGTATDLDSGMYTVMMEDGNGCSASDMIAIGSNVSIDQLLDAGINSISAYPNPSHGIVTIKVELANVDEMSVSISDLRGKAVWRSSDRTTSMFEEMVDLTDLPGGMYLIQVETSKGNSVQRLTLN